jgi:VanZ family protein
VTTRGAVLAHRLWIWGPAILYVGMIFYLSSQSYIPWASAAPDYVEHPVEYAGLAILVARALNDGLRRPLLLPLLLKALLLCILCGALDEIWQLWTPDRMSDVRDAMNDAIGAALGLGILLVGQRLVARGPRS